jgi:hypothetical protein
LLQFLSASAAVISRAAAPFRYEAAEGLAPLRALDDCNHALAEQALPPEERVATWSTANHPTAPFDVNG